MKNACSKIVSDTQYDWETLSGNSDAKCFDVKIEGGNLKKRNTPMCKKCVYKYFTSHKAVDNPNI